MAGNKNQTGLAGLAVLDGVMDCMEEADRVCDGFLQAMTNLADRCLKLCSSANASHVGKAAKRILALTNRVKDRQEKDREERIAAYWEQHAQEKQALDAEKDELQAKSKNLEGRMSALRSTLKEIKDHNGGLTPAEQEKEKLRGQRKDYLAQHDSLGIFKMKEKKRLKEEMALIDDKLAKLEEILRREVKERDAKLAELMEPHQDELDALEKEYKAAQARVQEINAEFVKDRSAEE